MYTFSSVGDHSIPKSVKCAHSATKGLYSEESASFGMLPLLFRGALSGGQFSSLFSYKAPSSTISLSIKNPKKESYTTLYLEKKKIYLISGLCQATLGFLLLTSPITKGKKAKLYYSY